MINQLLGELGFSDKEIAVYLCVLKNGKVTPANVARITKINRTTVYAVAKELLRRGVVAEDLGSKTGHLLALPPSDLQQLAVREEAELQKKRTKIAEAVAELDELTREVRYSVPKITFVQEEDLEAYLRKSTPLWNASAGKRGGEWWGFQDASFAGGYADWIDWHWKQPSSADKKLYMLSNRSPEEDSLAAKGYSNRHIKFWDKGDTFSASTWVVGDHVMMVHTKSRPHYLIDIHDAALAANQRALFKGIWEELPG